MAVGSGVAPLRSIALPKLSDNNRATLLGICGNDFRVGLSDDVDQKCSDLSERARKQSQGLMVNYLYDLGDIEKNHEAYAENRTIIAAGAIKKLARPSRALAQAAG